MWEWISNASRKDQRRYEGGHGFSGVLYEEGTHVRAVSAKTLLPFNGRKYVARCVLPLFLCAGERSVKRMALVSAWRQANRDIGAQGKLAQLLGETAALQ